MTMSTRVRRTTTTLLLLGGLACAGGEPVATADADGVALPVLYDADRWVLAPPTAAGDTVTFLLDTGGGANMLYGASLERFGLVPDTIGTGDDRSLMVAPPPLAAGVELPSWPPGPDGSAPLLVVDPPPGFDEGRSGFLGRHWFADRSWTFDYPGRRLLWHPDGLDEVPGASRVPLGFQVDSAGRRTMHFPRMQAVVDGDTLDLLFDTGATVTLRDSALAALADGMPAVRGTSFIITSLVDRWVERHPDWRVIPNAERGMRLVQVPEVRIGDLAVGPVWFIERPDPNFLEYMSQWMDRPVMGALGGSAFRDLVVSADYPNAVLWVRKP